MASSARRARSAERPVAYVGSLTARVSTSITCVWTSSPIPWAVPSTGGPAQLFRNVARRGGHWLTVRAIEPARGGRDAHGAEVRVQAGGRKWHRWVNPASGYLCSQDPRAHFGLGQIKAIDSIEVLWPDGVLELFTGGAPDRLVVVAKGSGKAAPTPPENEQAR